MSAKYQIFVSSTYEDLKEERDLVIKMILEMGHIPVGMEMFSAGNDDQWETIKRQIDQSDYYVVILAHRYGSCNAQGVGYTEMEYHYAAGKGLPCLGFVIDQKASWPQDKIDKKATLLKKLRAFKQKVQTRHVSYWSNKDELPGKCAAALTKQFNLHPREGWIRASLAQDANISKELGRLSAENSKLRQTIEWHEAAENERNDVSKTIDILKANEVPINVRKKDAIKWETTGNQTFFKIFRGLATLLHTPQTLSHISKTIAVIFGRMKGETVHDVWPIPRNETTRLLNQYFALRLLIMIDKQEKEKDPAENECWVLTEFGKKVLAEIFLRGMSGTNILADEEKNLESSTPLAKPVKGPASATRRIVGKKAKKDG